MQRGALVFAFLLKFADDLMVFFVSDHNSNIQTHVQFLPKLVGRLGDQLDVKTRAIVNLKQEISARDEMIKSRQERLLKHSNSQVCHD